MTSSGWSANTPTFRARRPASVSRACAGVRSRGPPAKITPRYSTPAASAYSASIDLVNPQILMSVATRAPRDAGERLRGADGIGRRRDARSDQYGIRTTGGVALDVPARADAALGHCDHPRRNAGNEALGGRRVDDERLEV